MNLRKTCPDIPDDWKGGVTATCAVLAEDGKSISRDTLGKYIRRGRRNGGIDWIPSKNGRKMFLGREIKRFWRSL